MVHASRATALSALLALIAAGCFRSHSPGRNDAGGMDASLDGGQRDASRDTGPPAPRDAEPDGDSGPPDAEVDGGACLEPLDDEPVVRACILEPLGALPAGEAGTLTLGFADCLCDARVCDVSVEGDVIDVSVVTCADPRECDDCERELPCTIPPLPAGDYTLRANGHLMASLPVRPRTSSGLAHPTCWRTQHTSTAERCEGIWPGNAPTGPMQLCHRDVEDVGTYAPIEVTVECPVCAGGPGQCEVRLDGNRLVVDATIRECGCTRCDLCPICEGLPGDHSARLTCSTPPLPIGDYELVIAGTELRSTLRVRDVTEPGPLVCASHP